MRRLILAAGLSLLGCRTAEVSDAPTAPAARGWIDASRRGAVVEAPIAIAGIVVPGIGLVHVDGQRVYVTGAAGTLDALDLVSGVLIFRSTEAVEPLRIVAPAVLAAFDDERRLVLLDTGDGHVLFSSQPTDVPGLAGVTRIEREHERLAIDWSISSWPHVACCGGGMPRTTTGGAIVDLRSGGVSLRPAETRDGPGFPGGAPAIYDAPVRLDIEVGPQVFDAEQTLVTVTTTLRGLDKATGAVLWTHPLPAQSYDPRPSPLP